MPRAIHLVRPTLLAAALCAANVALAAQPASAPFTPAQQQAIRQISASAAQAQVPLVASAAAASVAKTIEGEKQAIAVAKDALEVGRKSVDWWLSYLGVWLGGLGLLITLAGIGIPFLMGRQQKAEWQEKLADITQKLTQAQAAQQQAAAAQQQAEQHASEIEKLHSIALRKVSLMPDKDQLRTEVSTEILEQLRKEKPEHVVNLINVGWKAGHDEQWETAKTLWELISIIESSDPRVWTNLGFIYMKLGDFEQASRCYTFSNALSSNRQSLSDLGNALGQWADSLQDFEAPQREELFLKSKNLLTQATVNAPEPEYFKDLCATLIAWARHSPKIADGLLQEAEYLIPLLAEQARYYTLACIRAVQRNFEDARTLLEQAHAAGFLPDFAHLSTDRDLDNLRGLDWFQALLEEVKQQEAAS